MLRRVRTTVGPEVKWKRGLTTPNFPMLVKPLSYFDFVPFTQYRILVSSQFRLLVLLIVPDSSRRRTTQIKQ